MSARTLTLRIFAGVLVVSVVVGVTLLLALNTTQDVDRNSTSIGRNAQRLGNLQNAVRVSCYITTNALRLLGVPSQRDTGGPTGQAQRQTDPERLASLRLRAVRAAMTPAQRRLERELIAQIAISDGSPIPDCEEVVRHPERVKLYVPDTSTTRANP